ncbi:MAG TPA: SAVED domain-containing protein [Herpetosiphonaceae bacterium]|nr:SAVED domain-containing protein [Herpetosiphonaceae bacterium]
MAGSITARHQGDDYQARWFWMHACDLFFDDTHVSRVGYELNNIKSLDDIGVFYDDRKIDEDGKPLKADYIQVKFHVAGGGAITWEGLMDPAFINAQSTSILQRLKHAQRQYAPDGTGVRFFLYSPWVVDPRDELGHIWSEKDGRIIWAKLADGKTARSVRGKIRAAWREHLDVASDEELRVILQPLRIVPTPLLDQLQLRLNDRLRMAGLKAADGAVLHNRYDDLVRKQLGTGHTSFTRADIESVARREGFWVGPPVPNIQARRLGIRSFLRWTDHLATETENMLCLAHHFDGRAIKASELWQREVFPSIKRFLAEALPAPRPAQLEMPAHASVAFAAGYCLDPKAGVECSVIQRSAGKQIVWCPNPYADAAGYPQLSWTNEELPSRGPDVAIALSITQQVLADVREYVKERLPSVGRIVVFSLPSGPSTTRVQDGTHAKLLAQQLTAHLKEHRTGEERRGVVHIFAAAPNALLFFLGQMARSFGRCTLYEYDFETNALGGYHESLSFPPPIE